jgi:hypothetical protein
MRVLECMAGTGSVGRAFREIGAEVTSLDSDPKAKADICCDIMEWRPEQPPGHWDVVWFSPPCTEFSRALTTRERQLEPALAIVRRCLELIEELKPRYWFMENPWTGLLPKTDLCRDLPYRVVSYCNWGSETHRYRKHTWIATNCTAWQPHAKCSRANPCEHLENGKHPEQAQRGPTKGCQSNRQTLKQLYSMPHGLCMSIAKAASEGLQEASRPEIGELGE